ncbi:MAG: sigma factor-like helix-turn-helix DNA-binding protein [Pseudomonadota bacterium]
MESPEIKNENTRLPISRYEEIAAIDLPQLLISLNNFPIVFDYEKVVGKIDPKNITRTLFESIVSEDKRFISIDLIDLPDARRFITKAALYQWYVNLNFNLIKESRYTIDRENLCNLMNREIFNGIVVNDPPVEIIDWGASLGLIKYASENNEYFFPLIRILSHMPPSLLTEAKNILSRIFIDKQIWNLSSEKICKEKNDAIFSLLDDRESYIIKARFGVSTEYTKTLEEVGECLSLTRERVRQLEACILQKFHKTEIWRNLSVFSFLCDFVNDSGNLLFDRIICRELGFKQFLCMLLEIPCIPSLSSNLLILANTEKNLSFIKQIKYFPDNVDADQIFQNIKSKIKDYLSYAEAKIIAEFWAQRFQKKINKEQRVYLALKKIGRPAHYSEITEMHNSVWPDYASSEHNVHAVLGRKHLGVVWIGIDGTFALKEWGYEQPTETLFKLVARIVKQKYECSHLPVSFAVIVAEVGKHRKLVNPHSLYLACHVNPCITNKQGTFIPKDETEYFKDQISAEKLDEIFRNFIKQ